MVLILPHRGLGGTRRPKTKLHTLWKGPGEVVAIKANQVTVRDLNNDQFYDHHIRELKLYNNSKLGLQPKDVAAQDIDEYVVRDVLEHNGHSNNKEDLQFLIAWEGYSSQHDTWEPWENVKGNEKVLRYCMKIKGLKALVTPGVRTHLATKAALALASEKGNTTMDID